MNRSKTRPPAFRLRDTPFGSVAVLRSAGRGRPGVIRILLSRPGMPAEQALRERYPDSVAAASAEVDALLDRIEAFLNGEAVRFSLAAVRLDLCPPFQRKVLTAEHAIPRGRVSTYRLLAGRVGNPKGARAVGTALATNPFPLVIPCHRAIRSDGSLGGFQGGLPMKRALLAMEGVAFRDEHHVAEGSLYYGDSP
jgi:methylated-DNA-[protein]-cysteine S-methyltransferase